MITIEPNGGVGNQLFQYAAGRALSLHANVGLEVDPWHYGSEWESGDRPFQLHRLNVPVSYRRYTATGLRSANGGWSRIKRRVLAPRVRPHVRDSSLLSELEFFESPSNSILIGYFQSMRYFRRYLKVVVTELKNGLAGISLQSRIESRFSYLDSSWCAIQVRRGDFVGNELFDIIDHEKYFTSAISYMVKSHHFNRFIVFSDDPSWCRANKIFRSFEIHQCEPQETPLETFITLTKCGGHIISNSSFGWWAAALSSACGPVVIPEYWLSAVKTSEVELLLDHWRSI